MEAHTPHIHPARKTTRSNKKTIRTLDTRTHDIWPERCVVAAMRISCTYHEMSKGSMVGTNNSSELRKRKRKRR